ncbi:MAG: hypothetical protein JWO76_2396 [Nocardioides sp.]|nr:hypothetical protein [Nocardioides sp.]
MTRPARSGPTVAAFLLALTLVVSGCSGGDDTTGRPVATGGTAASGGDGPAPLATRATLGKITGKLPKPARQKLKESVTAVVDGWLDAAYVGGDYPRSDFHDAFPGFTSGAKDDAHRDRALMSNQSIGKRIDEVSATRRRLRIDALVVHRRPAGVTARFILGFRTSGDLERTFEVRGRLFLIRNGGWRVFGYDVSKGVTQGGKR